MYWQSGSSLSIETPINMQCINKDVSVFVGRGI